MKILMFGAKGAVGTAIEECLNAKGVKFSSPSSSQCDIRDHARVEAMIEKESPTVIINCVALIGINLCEQNPRDCIEVNATAVHNLARQCQARGITFVQPSSHAVFDGEKDGYYTEDDQPNPLNLYGASKYLSECCARNNCEKHYVVRFPTLFGDRRNQALGFVDKMLARIIKHEPLRVPTDKIDSPSYTRDVAEVLVDLIEAKRPYGTYHLANTGQVSYYDFVVYLAKLVRESASITPVLDSEFPSLARAPLKTALASKKLPALRSWQKALEQYVGSLEKIRGSAHVAASANR